MTASVVDYAISADFNNGTSHTVSLPASLVSGDLLMLLGFTSSSSVTWTTPAGWTASSTGAINGTYVIFYKVSNGSEGASLTLTSSISTRMQSYVAQISGFKSGSSPSISSVATGTSLAPQSPSLSPSWGLANTLWFSVVYTSRQVTSWPLTDNNVFQSEVAVCTQSINTATEAPGAYAVAISGAWGAFTIGIEPAVIYSLSAAEGSFSFTGNAVTFISNGIRSIVLIATAGLFGLLGGHNNLVYTPLIKLIGAVRRVAQASLVKNRSQDPSLNVRRRIP